MVDELGERECSSMALISTMLQKTSFDWDEAANCAAGTEAFDADLYASVGWKASSIPPF